MCEICDKIYKKNEPFFLKDEEDDAIFIREYINHYNLTIFCSLRYYDIDDGEQELIGINYCPFCGKQVSFDREYKDTLLDKKYKIIKEGN